MRPQRPDSLAVMSKLAIIGGGNAAVIHAESSRAVAGVQLIGIGGRSLGRARRVAESLGCEELTVAEAVRRADMLVVAVPPPDVGEVLAQIPPDRALIVESPVGVDSRCDPADRPNAMLGANLLHAPIPRRGLAAVNDLGEPHHLLLRANAPRPAWHTAGGPHSGVTLDLGGRLLPVLLAAAAQPVVEVSARLNLQGGVDTAAELELRLSDGRLVRARLHWGGGPTTANLEAASGNAVVSLDLWPSPVLEVDGAETASDGSQQRLHALGFVSQLRRLAAVAANRATAWPELSSGFGTLRIIEAARLSARSGRVQQLD